MQKDSSHKIVVDLHYPPLKKGDVDLILTELSTDTKRIFSMMDVSLLTGFSIRRLIYLLRAGVIQATYMPLPKLDSKERYTRYYFDFEDLLPILVLSALDSVMPDFSRLITEEIQKDGKESANIKIWLKNTYKAVANNLLKRGG